MNLKKTFSTTINHKVKFFKPEFSLKPEPDKLKFLRASIRKVYKMAILPDYSLHYTFQQKQDC